MMKLQQIRRTAVAAIFAAGLCGAHAQAADEVSESQLKAARTALAAIGITTQYDVILPRLAQQLKATLIQASPNYEELINATVDEKAIEFASRRGDLEKEAAQIYAKTFTEDELKKITEFYTSPVGQKLMKDGPIAARELSKAADIWGTGITRDLSKSIDDVLEAKIGEQVKNQAPAQQ